MKSGNLLVEQWFKGRLPFFLRKLISVNNHLGLKRNTVRLLPYHESWKRKAEECIAILHEVLGSVAVDIQHAGSTAVPGIHAKPVIDIIVGVRSVSDVLLFCSSLEQHGVFFRGEDVPGQLLFVMGDMENDTRTHHIHVVRWKGTAWNNYLYFRDTLLSSPETAAEYDTLKLDLAERFSNDRRAYTKAKESFITGILNNRK